MRCEKCIGQCAAARVRILYSAALKFSYIDYIIRARGKNELVIKAVNSSGCRMYTQKGMTQRRSLNVHHRIYTYSASSVYNVYIVAHALSAMAHKLPPPSPTTRGNAIGRLIERERDARRNRRANNNRVYFRMNVKFGYIASRARAAAGIYNIYTLGPNARDYIYHYYYH